jgi:hypothetical protein
MLLAQKEWCHPGFTGAGLCVDLPGFVCGPHGAEDGLPTRVTRCAPQEGKTPARLCCQSALRAQRGNKEAILMALRAAVPPKVRP